MTYYVSRHLYTDQVAYVIQDAHRPYLTVVVWTDLDTPQPVIDAMLDQSLRNFRVLL